MLWTGPREGLLTQQSDRSQQWDRRFAPRRWLAVRPASFPTVVGWLKLKATRFRIGIAAGPKRGASDRVQLL